MKRSDKIKRFDECDRQNAIECRPEVGGDPPARDKPVGSQRPSWKSSTLFQDGLRQESGTLTVRCLLHRAVHWHETSIFFKIFNLIFCKSSNDSPLESLAQPSRGKLQQEPPERTHTVGRHLIGGVPESVITSVVYSARGI